MVASPSVQIRFRRGSIEPAPCSSRGEIEMFRGMIMGMMLTVGAAYAADSMAGADARPIVNWDVAAGLSVDAAHFVRDQFASLIDRVHASPSEPAEPAVVSGY